MGADVTSVAVGPALPERDRRAVPTLTQRASLTAAASLLDYSARLAVSFVVTPILVGGLGRSLFGVWEMLNRMVNYMSAADGRPSDALRLLVANRQEAHDVAGQRRAVGSALVVWLLFLPVVAVVGATLVWFSPIIAHATPALSPTIRLTCAFLVGDFVLGTLGAVPESALRGMNLGYRRMGWQAGLSIVGGLLAASAVSAGFGLAGVGAAQILLAALTGLLFWVLVKQYVPWFGVARPTKPEVKSLLGMSIWLTGGDLIAKLSLASDVLILGMIRSPAVVTSYVLTSYAARTALGMLGFTVGAAMPGLGGVIGQQQYERAARARAEIMVFTWLFMTAVGAAVLAWNRSFLGLWVGRDHFAGFWPNLLIVLVTAQTAFIRCDAYVIDATLQPRLRVVVGAVAAALIIVFGVLLTPALGMVGLSLGIMAGRLTQTIGYPMLVNTCLGRPRTLAWRPLVRPLLVSALLLGGAAYLGQRVLVGHWIEWALAVGGTFAVTLGAALVLGLPAEPRRALVRRLTSLQRGARG